MCVHVPKIPSWFDKGQPRTEFFVPWRVDAVCVRLGWGRHVNGRVGVDLRQVRSELQFG